MRTIIDRYNMPDLFGYYGKAKHNIPVERRGDLYIDIIISELMLENEDPTVMLFAYNDETEYVESVAHFRDKDGEYNKGEGLKWTPWNSTEVN